MHICAIISWRAILGLGSSGCLTIPVKAALLRFLAPWSLVFLASYGSIPNLTVRRRHAIAPTLTMRTNTRPFFFLGRPSTSLILCIEKLAGEIWDFMLLSQVAKNDRVGRKNGLTRGKKDSEIWRITVSDATLQVRTHTYVFPFFFFFMRSKMPNPPFWRTIPTIAAHPLFDCYWCAAPDCFSCLCASRDALVSVCRITRWRGNICCIITVNQAIQLQVFVSLPSLVTCAAFSRLVVGHGGCGTHGQLRQYFTRFGHRYVFHISSPGSRVDTLICHPLEMEGRVSCPLEVCVFPEFEAPRQAGKNGLNHVRRHNQQDSQGVRETKPKHAKGGIVTA